MNRDDAPSPDTPLRRLRARLVDAVHRVLGVLWPSDSDDGRERSGSDTNPRRDDGRSAREDGGDGPLTGSILTPEERVVQVITRNGGSVKQADIVDALDLSESTVSRKLSKLESDERITRYRIGREKLVFLPGSEPPSLGSPLARDDVDQSTRA